MRLISGPLSLFGKKVEIALAEKGVAFERILSPFSQTKGYAPKNPDVLRVNPKGQVPVLIDGDIELYDSTVIIEYLEDAFPAPPLYPAGAREKAKCRLMELYADEVILADLRLLMHRNEPGATARENWREKEEVAARAEDNLSRHYEKIDSALAGRDYLFSTFGAADIAAFLQLFYAQRLGGPSMKSYGRLWAWYARVKSRPSVATVVTETLAADAELSAPVAGAFKDAP